MPRNSRHEQALTTIFIGVIAFLFIFEARVALQPDRHLTFDIGRMNLAFGYGSSSSSVGVEAGNCTNAFDDDNDGLIDCNDSDCSGDPACVVSSSAASSSSVGIETGNCANAFDDDNDGLIDCNDSDCSGDPACVVSSSAASSSSSSIACGGTSGADQTMLYSGHCYMLFASVDKTWTNAKAACSAYSGSYLASITDSMEQNQIVNSFSSLGSSTFIGLNDRSIEGTYAWDHGDTLSYTAWASGQPDNSGDQDCTVLSQSVTYLWDDHACGNVYDYMCEMSMTATCGNGTRENAEACDDGDTSSGDGCSSTCTVESGWSCAGAAPTVCSEVCGNGIVTSGEACDDGNTSNGDGCSSSCIEQSGWSCIGEPSGCSTSCGDGIVAGPESCDDGNMTDTDTCRNTCVFASCGDSVVQENGSDDIPGNADDESCDSGGESVSCNDNCTAVACGDQNVNEAAGETCDDGNSSNLDGCLSSCVTASCGDGYVRAAVEECEPPGVGTCGGSCREERGIGNVSADVEETSYVVRAGPPPHCGNGVLEEALGEACDQGRFNGLSPLCDRWCNARFCGDGIVHAEDEECEPLLQGNGKFAAETCGGRTCTIPVCSEKKSCFGGCHWVFLPACQISVQPAMSLFPVQENHSVMNSVENKIPSVSPIIPETPLDSSPPPLPVFTAASSSAAAEFSVMYPVMQLPVFSINLPPPSSGPVAFAEACGNGIQEGVETCDNGPQNSDVLPDSCRINCRLPVCGDKVTDFGEQCDDGNEILGDSCTPLCTRSACGNNVLESGEECDDGSLNSATKPDSCSDRCLLPSCGDSVLDAAFGEQCDQGPNNSNDIPDRCRLNCLRPHCGDSIQDDGEDCDDGNGSNLDSCSIACKKIGCGNGVKDWNEACDDGNTLNGDGCSGSCLLEKQSFLQWLNEAVRLPFGW